MDYTRANPDVQDHRRFGDDLRLQDCFRRRQDLWIRPGLRHHGLRQEVRAQVQIDQATGCRKEGPELEETAQRKEEQDEEGQRYQEGQGRSRWKEVIGYTQGLEDDILLAFCGWFFDIIF